MSKTDIMNAANASNFGLLHLPTEILEKVLSYLTYDEISICRPTCRAFNALASSCLNKGFSKADRLHGTIQREVKSKLPRRESERRNHPLARHVDILSAVETRLSLLSMTYSKYIEIGLCCFIPGKVLDEIYRVLRSVRVNPNPPRAHELLQELRDISSMAMEHFDEKIVPSLKTRMPTSPELRLILSSSTACSGTGGTAMAGSSLFKFRGTTGIQPQPVASTSSSRQHASNSDEQRKQLRRLRTELRQRLASRDTRITDLSSKIADQERKLAEQNRTIAELNRRVIEYDQRFDDIMAEFARIHDGTPVKRHTKTKSASSSQAVMSPASRVLRQKLASRFKPTKSAAACTVTSNSDAELDVDKTVENEQRVTRAKKVEKRSACCVEMAMPGKRQCLKPEVELMKAKHSLRSGCRY